jgi:tetratricopeptide (TPR) repeat protein
MLRTLIVASLLTLLVVGSARADAPRVTPPPPTTTTPPTPPPSPPPAPWRDLYHQGSLAYDAGRLDEALSDFTRAFDLGGPPSLLYDMALTTDRLGRTADAIAAYQRYLDAAPDASNRDVVEARLTELSASASSSPILAPIPTDTHPATTTTTTGSDVYLARQALPTRDHWEQQGPEWVASWVMLALTSATVAATVIVWNDGLGHFQQLQDLCASPMGCTATDIHDSSAHASQDATNALLGISVGLGAITVLTFIVEGVVTGNRMRFVRGDAAHERRGPRLSIGPFGLSVSGTF